MKIIFLIPPSEGKNLESIYDLEELKYCFNKPNKIAKNASENDLKCKGSRFEEAILLNKNINKNKTIEAINRYSGVMYKSINYKNMNEKSRIFFQQKFLILSGMYGIVHPLDKIGNYKLPIETKGLVDFWKDDITKKLNELDVDFIVDLLPNSYKKMLDFKNIKSKIISVNFLDSSGKKLSHGVKNIKGEFINMVCNFPNFDLFKDLEKINDNFFKKNINI